MLLEAKVAVIARWRWFNLWRIGLLRYRMCPLKSLFPSLLVAENEYRWTDEREGGGGWALKKASSQAGVWRQFWRFTFSHFTNNNNKKAAHWPLIPISFILTCMHTHMLISILNGRLLKYNFMDDCKYRLLHC